MTNFSFAQIEINGVIIDRSSNQIIPYVNIGILNKNIGTISASNGSFKLNFPNELKNDTLIISSVGYQTKKIPLTQFKNKDTISLLEKIEVLNNVTITANKKLKKKKLGVKRIMPGVYGEVKNSDTNDIVEIGQLIHLDTIWTNIISYHIFLKNLNTEEAKFRINFYRFNGTEPAERIFEKEILTTAAIENGWLKVDLEKYNIWLKGEIIVSIEFLPDEKKNDLILFNYGGLLICKEISYSRKHSLGKWDKLDFGTFAIYLIVKK